MAQDDPVVSAQWLQQHLGQPDIKVKESLIRLTFPPFDSGGYITSSSASVSEAATAACS